MTKIFAFMIGLFLCLHLYAQTSETSFQDDFGSGTWSLRTNIPTWFLAFPNLGVEYRATQRWGLVLDGIYSPWNFKRKDKAHYWRLWNVSPEVRYAVGKESSAYLGLHYSMGEYNISSQQGRYFGGGVSFGKQYIAGKKLLVDVGLTLGYLQFRTRESFRQSGETFYRTNDKGTRHYWGPTSLSIRLARKLNEG